VFIRGQRQDVYFIPATTPSAAPQKILFAPGDGGWHGLAITIGETIASWGYDVYGIDTKRYLESFTGKTMLTEGQVMADMRSVAEWAAPGPEKVLLVGWSNGAGLFLLAATSPDRLFKYGGLVTIGLTETSTLGWRLADDITWITKGDPNEPSFRSRPYLPEIAPLRLAMIYSEGDEYISTDAAKKMFTAAQEPKDIRIVAGRNHRFDGARDEFFRTLREELAWAAGAPR
jgi:dienelactone hydrolase